MCDKKEKIEFLNCCRRQMFRMGKDFGSTALCSKLILEPGEKKNILFVLSWFFPNHLTKSGKRLGHYYENLYKSALDANRFLANNSDTVYKAAKDFSDLLYNTSLPSFYPDAWSSNLSQLIKSSCYLKNGKFVEATRQQIIESKMMRGETVPFIKETRLSYMPYLEIDLNFSLDYKNGDATVVKDMLSRTQKVQMDGMVVQTLGEADFFLHLCAHLYKEASTVPWIRMKRDMTFYKFCDIYMLLSGLSDNAAKTIVSFADENQLARELAYAVNAVQEFFGVSNPVFDEFMETMSRDSLTRVVAPAEKKIYQYREPSVVLRFFAKDRMRLLEECV